MDVDLFGEPTTRTARSATPTKHTDIFSVNSDLSDGERHVVANYIRDVAARYIVSDERRQTRLLTEAHRYRSCGQHGIAYQCPQDYLRYFVRMYCHSRICERCARIYVRDLRRSILPVLQQVDGNRRRGYVLAQLTLTVTSKRFGEDLPDREGIRRLYKESTQLLNRYFGKYARRRSRSGRWYEDRKRYIGAGWLATIEVGRDNNNLHIHALTYGPIRSQRALSEAWAKITGDSFGVDIRKKKPKQAADYVLKYIAKPPATDSYHRIAEYADMIKGSRRLRSGGIFYNRFKQARREKTSKLCPICGGGLKYEDVLPDLTDPRYLDLKAMMRDPDSFNVADLRKIAADLPGGVTPVSLPN